MMLSTEWIPLVRGILAQDMPGTHLDALTPIPGSVCGKAADRPGMMVMDSSPLSIGIARRAMLVE
jgi:hypothetical protein